MRKLLILTVLATAIAGFAAGCASSQPTTGAANAAATNTTATTTTNATTAPGSQTANTNHSGATDETPAMVKAAFPAAQSFTVQHKDVSGKAAAIEKDAGAKVQNNDHHSYLAFTSEGGTRKQIGAATIVKAAGRDVVIVYENKKGLPYIKEVRAEGVPAQFLAQFAGKGHDDKMQIGADLKTNGADEAIAKAIAEQVRLDAITMQTLYGATHTH